jgi:murein DD-endopeptidase MepM/ murein hydrolase activator NlpD
MADNTGLTAALRNQSYHPVVSFDHAKDTLLLLDFTETNKELSAEVVEDIVLFSDWVNQTLQTAGAKYGIGGYGEHRTVYSRSRVFDDPSGGEPRRLHLGVDIWGSADTVVFAPLDGVVHSFAFNNAYGDYGATIILQHRIGKIQFHSLYGHLSLRDLDGLYEGKPVQAGETIAHLGEPEENGHWPPHLHFQLIVDMEGMKGDYPGVCRFSEREKYLSNCSDPDIILRMMQFVK